MSKKIIFLTCFFALTGTALLSASGISVGGSIDMNMGSNVDPSVSGSLNIEFNPLTIFSLGLRIAGESDFETKYIATPTAFARLYPFAGLFAEGSLGGKFSKVNNVSTRNLSAGASFGWRISSGGTYIEPKLNLEYVFGADEPFSWAMGVGAGYSF